MRWGQFHKGIDIARPYNRTIKAADNGVVVFAGWDGGYGKKIIIDHRNGFRTVYAHLATISVRVGQTVQKGQKIGVMGSTGNSRACICILRFTERCSPKSDEIFIIGQKNKAVRKMGTGTCL